MRTSGSSIAKSAISHGVLILGAIVFLTPFVWMLSISIKPTSEIFRPGISLWPSRFNAEQNYANALAQMPILRQMMNSFIVCLTILILQILTSVGAAYPLSKLRFRGRAVVFALVLICLAIPIQVPAIPLYLAFANLGLLNSYVALIIPFGASAFGIFLLRQYFLSFPDEVVEAARLDGYSEFGIVWLVVLPSSWPAVASFAIFELIYHWNDLYWPLIVVTNPDVAPLPFGLASFKSQSGGADFGALMAATVCVTAPLLIAFLFTQRTFARGIAAGIPG